MPFALKVLIWIVMFMASLGLLMGMLNVLNPQAVHIPFGPDGKGAVGIDGVIAATLSAAVMGLVIGIPAALATWLIAPVDLTKKKNRQRKKHG